METLEKLKILADAAKYDVSCSSSGSDRGAKAGMLGNTAAAGICHSWSDDGRCISLLKVLMTNKCIYDCAYCINRTSNDIPRAEFEPEEVVKLTMNFYRRNYIEGLFLSSGVVRNPNYTMERLIAIVKQLREVERFNGYIHLKGIPGADDALIELAGKYVDRMSVNIELPKSSSLKLLAPQKDRKAMIEPMMLIRDKIEEYSVPTYTGRKSKAFVPAGQSTQVIIGATNESDKSIIKISEAMYNRMSMKRVYYSAYVPVSNHPAVIGQTAPPLGREHRLYQADWLLRFYDFKADEILPDSDPHLDLMVDPKAQWALRNLHLFPMEINKVPFKALLRIPGIGNISARRIAKARRINALNFDDLKRLGVVLKRAKYFITAGGKYFGAGDLDPMRMRQLLIEPPKGYQAQVSLFETNPDLFEKKEGEDKRGLLT